MLRTNEVGFEVRARGERSDPIRDVILLKQCRHGQMYYNPNDVYIGRSLELYGEFSEEEVSLFEKIVSPTDVAVDVGANIGTHTVPLSRLAREVWALEPQKSIFDCLCANIAVNGLRNVHCLH